MCACGCFVLVAAAGGLAWCWMNQQWLLFGAIIAAMAAIIFFGKKYANWRPGQKK